MEASGLLGVARARQAEVDAVLDRFFSVSRRRAEPLGLAYVELWDALAAATDGGKRFRPLMVITAYDALGGDDHEAAANVGAAFELLHTALIVHDDVIDRDFVRRGGPNVAGTYRDRAAGSADAAYKTMKPVFRTSYDQATGLSTVDVEQVVTAGEAPTKRYDPSNPVADKDGNIFEAAVDETRELVDMMETARTYQNNVEVMQTAKQLIVDTLKMGR